MNCVDCVQSRLRSPPRRSLSGDQGEASPSRLRVSPETSLPDLRRPKTTGMRQSATCTVVIISWSPCTCAAGELGGMACLGMIHRLTLAFRTQPSRQAARVEVDYLEKVIILPE